MASQGESGGACIREFLGTLSTTEPAHGVVSAAAVAGGHDLVRADLLARIDDDLHAIPAHMLTVAGSADQGLGPLRSGISDES